MVSEEEPCALSSSLESSFGAGEVSPGGALFGETGTVSLLTGDGSRLEWSMCHN